MTKFPRRKNPLAVAAVLHVKGNHGKVNHHIPSQKKGEEVDKTTESVSASASPRAPAASAAEQERLRRPRPQPVSPPLWRSGYGRRDVTALLRARDLSSSTRACSPRHHRQSSRDSAARSSSPHRPAPGPHQGCLRRRPGCLRIATRSIFLTAPSHFPAYAGSGPFRPRPRAVRFALCLNRHQAAWCLASCIRASPLHHRLAAAATAAPPPAARCLRPCCARLFCARRPGRFAVLFLPCAHAAADKPPSCQTATMSALAPAAEPPGRG